jgi:hypothetical protein
MGAEDPAVDVCLVDHDHGEVREEVAPGGVVGEDPDVKHVGVGQHQVRPPADLGALRLRRVPVEDRGPGALDAERVQGSGLVLREGLARVQVQRPGLGVAGEDVERRQVEAERLPRRGTGGDDGRAGPGRLQRLGLMGVERVDPRGAQGARHLRMERIRQLDQPRRPRVGRALGDQPVVVATGLQELVPGLDRSRDGHRGRVRPS